MPLWFYNEAGEDGGVVLGRKRVKKARCCGVHKQHHQHQHQLHVHKEGRPKTANLKMDKVLRRADSKEKHKREPAIEEADIWQADYSETAPDPAVFRPCTSSSKADAHKSQRVSPDIAPTSLQKKTEIWQRQPNPITLINPESFQVVWSAERVEADQNKLWKDHLKYTSTQCGGKTKTKEKKKRRAGLMTEAVKVAHGVLKAEGCARQLLAANFEIGLMKLAKKSGHKPTAYWNLARQNAVEEAELLFRQQRRARLDVEEAEVLSRRYVTSATKSSSTSLHKRRLLSAEQETRAAVVREELVAYMDLVSLDSLYKMSLQTMSAYIVKVQSEASSDMAGRIKREERDALWEKEQHVESMWQADEHRFQVEYEAARRQKFRN